MVVLLLSREGDFVGKRKTFKKFPRTTTNERTRGRKNGFVTFSNAIAFLRFSFVSRLPRLLLDSFAPPRREPAA